MPSDPLHRLVEAARLLRLDKVAADHLKQEPEDSFSDGLVAISDALTALEQAGGLAAVLDNMLEAGNAEERRQAEDYCRLWRKEQQKSERLGRELEILRRTAPPEEPHV